MLIIPSSNSQVEIASTEIFILEYIQRQMTKINQKKQLILVAPSRVDRNQLREIQFPGLGFLNNCFICPPIFRISQINNQVLNDFWFRIDNNIISENMQEFGNFVHDHLLEVKKRKAEAPMTLQPRVAPNLIKPITPLAERAQSSATPVTQAQKEFSFIPSFLRKK